MGKKSMWQLCLKPAFISFNTTVLKLWKFRSLGAELQKAQNKYKLLLHNEYISNFVGIRLGVFLAFRARVPHSIFCVSLLSYFRFRFITSFFAVRALSLLRAFRVSA
jgi:hypothetical protein